MLDKISKIILITFLLILIGCGNVLAYTGSGIKTNPYIVSAESGLREILTEIPKKTSWVYIAINGTITINKNITVSGGKYRIYAYGADRTIKRSSETNSAVNNQSNPQYCIKLANNAEMVMGFNASDYKLRLGGNKNYFGNTYSSGWFNVADGCTLTIGVNGHLTNAINNEYDQTGSIISSSGNLIINGEISNCQGIRGGAISMKSGSLEINGTAKIHNCKSETEGGAIFLYNSSLVMNDGEIYNNASLEEGGAIFIGANSTGKILGGNIYNNSSDKTGGGIFSGYGALLYIGQTGSVGPNIFENEAAGSGGGVRCNGGINNTAGGTAYFYSGVIRNNASGNVGGGIACGSPGSDSTSKLIIKDMQILNNTSKSAGGGIWIPKDATGINSNDVKIDNCEFLSNKSDTQGGGMTVHGQVTLSNSSINYNEATGNGGGIYIGDEAVLIYKGEKIVENISKGYGNGIYVKGQFKISDEGIVSGTNDVYLAVGKYIEVIGQVKGDTFLRAAIRSAVTSNGTKIVKVNYSGADSETDLYHLGNANSEYSDDTVRKRYKCNNISTNQLIRAGKYVDGIDSQWIVISQQYNITYNKNIAKKVENLPGIQKKFWNESIVISTNEVTLNGYEINEEAHWNSMSDGTGQVIKPGSVYNENGNKTLYAQWIQVKIQQLFLITSDRYYVVGQDLVLTSEELLKKVKVTDDLDTGADYKVFVVEILDNKGNSLISDNDIKTEDFINTLEEKHYILKVKTVDDSGLITDEEIINVYIMDNDFNANVIRFISLDFIYTLHEKSKWNKDLKEILLNSLNNISSNSNKKIYLSQEKVKEVKQKVREQNYIITNIMNKDFVESW